ncbi:MAG TPA: DUF2264 domain-containing protein [Dinghuibacter sp.]|uniref:DUF2264 domain-containing protein n=1 Tax=Dinghuibacter sp. TaxID=2024697 RepID=UPI002CEE09BF|nr:DUF2264 domain-containing protein [Dinghuibacter sp.]HTJ11914.1 DUF2264 domain-containing protein [Dinghuibacter sp.]
MKYLIVLLLPLTAAAQTDRAYWLKTMDRLARPVIYHLSNDNLRAAMPVGLSPKIDNATLRRQDAYLEAFGRLMSGIAPWMNLEGGSAEEVALRKQYREWSLKAIANAVNPKAKDYMAWTAGGQPLVDASYLALAFLRCPWLWDHLDTTARRQVADAFLLTRSILPAYNNWLLFQGMIEAFFCHYGLPWDKVRVDYAIRQMQQWYVGDGVYSDGAEYRWDYYNSYVIHPYLTEIVTVIGEHANTYQRMLPQIRERDERYAEIQERLIGTDGSYPATGRSIVYRCGAFQHLADMALRKALPASLTPAQVRGALTAVIHRTLDAPGTFSPDGWLQMGLAGNQPDLADWYITTGSGYLCANVFLPLGLPDSDPFWADAPAPWTAVKVWSGQAVTPDHAID